jgi:chorismate mutase
MVTYVLIGTIAAAVGLASVLGIGAMWMARKIVKLGDQRVELGDLVAEAKAETTRWQLHVEQLEEALKDKSNRVLREVAARKKVEDQRDHAIKRLLETGDPADVADALRIDLDRLRDLSSVPDVPPGTIATPPGGDED